VVQLGAPAVKLALLVQVTELVALDAELEVP
jgi:hypothetical protein